MTEGDRAGCWALAYLLIALVAVWFNIIMIVAYHIKAWFL